MRFLKPWLFLAVVTILTSCQEKRSASPAAAKNDRTDEQVFTVNGIVKKLAEGGSRTVTIQHELVPNFMPAMTMPFSVKDTNQLHGVQPGDTISFRLHVTGEESWIDQIRKVGDVKTNEPAERPSVRLVKEVEPLKVGDVMPDYRFTNELGRAVSLSDFKGGALVLTFIFTRCPLPEFCPLMSRNFAAAHKQLTLTPGAPTNWHLLSVSFDPHFDTPGVMKRYAQLYQYDPEHWSFVTGAMIDIDAITEQFDLPVSKQGENWQHKLRTVVIDAAGRIQGIFPGNAWTVEELVAEITKAARVRNSAEPVPKPGS